MGAPTLAIPAAAAVLAAVVVEAPPELRFPAIAALLALLTCVLLCRQFSAVRVLTGVALVAAAFSSAGHLQSVERLQPGRTQRFACTVLGDVQSNNGASSFSCLLDNGRVVLVDLSGAPPPIAQRIEVRGRLEPFDDGRNPGEPSRAAIERERGIIAQIAAARLMRQLPSRGTSWRVAIARAHAWALEQFRLRLPEPAASILAGALWGEKSALPPDLRAEFQETGTVHVLVTAGLHLGAVAALIVGLLRCLKIGRLAECSIAVAAIWAYAVFSGLHLPAVRAATMLSFALAARAAGAKALSWNAFAAAALAIALLDPAALISASFALSFSCVASIFLNVEFFAGALKRFAGWPFLLREAVAVSAATQIGTWPLTASIFLLFAPYGILANVAVVPFVGVTMLLGVAQLAFAPIPLLAQAAANLNAWVLAWIVGCVRAVSGLPFAVVRVTPAPLWAIAAYDAAIALAALAWMRGARTLALTLAITGIGAVIEPPRPAPHALRITVLDVGQADSIVIQTPLGHALLVDGGGRLERGPQSSADSVAEQVGARIVVPFLLREGVKRVDALLISHPHGDHVGGCRPVLDAVSVGLLADSGQMYAGHAYRDCVDTARATGVPIAYPRAGTVWRTDDGVTLQFIGPSRPFIQSKNTINDNSLAFILQYRSFRMLFTGDAGFAAEQRFLSQGVDLHADVLKVGHHGSSYSSSPEFLAAVHPKYAIISVGRHNMFGHPALSTIASLARIGAAVYRTDQNGGVTITIDRSKDSTSVAPLLR